MVEKRRRKFASAEQHRKWIKENKIKYDEWQHGRYKDFENAHGDPCRKFNKPWSWFSGDKALSDPNCNSIGVPVASAEQHRKWIAGNNISYNKWVAGEYKTYSHLGAIACPDRRFKLPKSYFSNIKLHAKKRRWTRINSERVNGMGVPVASDEQHREWICKEQCSYAEWYSEVYKKYAPLGAIAAPQYTSRKSGWCKKKWSWFTTGKNTGKKKNRASAQQHRKWISENGYTSRTWKRNYTKFSGAVSTPVDVFNKPWSWFRNLTTAVYVVYLNTGSYEKISLRNNKFMNYAIKQGIRSSFYNTSFVSLMRHKRTAKIYHLKDDMYLVTDEEYFENKCLKTYYWVKDLVTGQFERGIDNLDELCSYLNENNKFKILNSIRNGGVCGDKEIVTEKYLDKSKFNKS